MEQQDYFSSIPLEILAEIVRYLEGTELAFLMKISNYFICALDYPEIWRSVFNNTFASTIKNVNHIDGSDINWKREVKQHMTLQRRSTFRTAPDVKFNKLYFLHGVGVYKNRLLTCEGILKGDMRKLTALYGSVQRLYHWKYILQGPLWSRRGPERTHTIYDWYNQDEPVIYKKLLHEKIHYLPSFNRTLAILGNSPLSPFSIWNLSTKCKHTDEVLWNNSADKSEPCEICAKLMLLPYYPYSAYVCSQVNEKIVLVLRKTLLKVFYPFEGAIFYIPNDMCQIEVDTCTLAYQYKNTPRVLSEQMINIDGTVHHIVHCTVNKQHQFYDLTAKKMMATINCWIMHVWIPNTCYLAMATRDTVIVIDFNTKKIVSRFRPKDDKNETRKVIKALQASRSSPVLLIGMTKEYRHTRYFSSKWEVGYYKKKSYKSPLGVVLLYSALTGVRISYLAELTWDQTFQIALTEDEKKMVLWKPYKMRVYDLSDNLTCVQQHDDENK